MEPPPGTVPPRPDLPLSDPTATVYDSWEPPLNMVRGESHYQGAISALMGGLHQGLAALAVATLTREPANPHDPNAIRVEVGGVVVGHVAAAAAAELAPVLDRAGCQQLAVQALVRAGLSEPVIYGVHLWPGRPLSDGPPLELSEGVASAMRVPWGTSTEPMNASPAYRLYWELAGFIEVAWDARDFAAVADASRQTCAIIGEVVEVVVATRGRFYPTAPPAIERGCSCLAIGQDHQGLLAWLEVVDATPALAEWRPLVERSMEEEAIVGPLLAHLDEQGSVVQSKLGALLGVPGRRVQHVCWLGEEAGFLRRARDGKTITVSRA